MADPVSNGLFGVPWAIGGGDAILQAEVARYLAYQAMGGQEGILGKDHLAPRELATPGSGIRLSPGGCAILNRTLGSENQSYIDLAQSEISVSLDPTTGAGRTDLVMIRVEDPYVSGNSWSVPGDLQDGPYIFARVEYGVSSAIKTVSELGHNWSAIPICRITRPASTATILNSHITDLRILINPLTGGVQPAPNATFIDRAEFTDIKQGSGNNITTGMTSYSDWPPECNWTVPVPSWATYLELDIELKTVEFFGGSFWGDIRPVIAGVNQAAIVIDKNNTDVGATNDQVWVGGEYYIAPSLRGTNITIKTQAKSNGEPGTMRSFSGTYTRAHFKFKQTPGVA